MINLEKLNRLRVNVGKPELSAFKGSQAKLAAAIKTLEDAGALDVVPGANVEAKPTTNDVEILDAMAKPEKEEKEEIKVTKIKPHLARGLDTDTMAKNSRRAVQVHRMEEKASEKTERKAKKKAEKEAKAPLSKEDKRKIKEEAKSRIAGEVDAKKEPEKAARQKKHIEEKRAAREAKKADPKPAKDSKEITAAEVARELGIDPKVARAKLRRYKDKLTKLYAKGVTDGWTFPKSSKDALIEILK